MPNERTINLEQQIGALTDESAFLDRIAQAGQQALVALQDKEQAEPGAVPSQALAAYSALDTRMAGLAEHATTAASWDHQDLALFASELSGLVEAHEVIIVILEPNNSGATSCRQNYDTCIDNECGPGGHGTVCLCCVPCSLEYIGCLRKLIVGLLHQGNGIVAGDPSHLQNAPET